VKFSVPMVFAILSLMPGLALASADGLGGSKFATMGGGFGSASSFQQHPEHSTGVRSPVHRLIPGHENSHLVRKRNTVIRKQTRFLGWNYAKAHPEQTNWLATIPSQAHTASKQAHGLRRLPSRPSARKPATGAGGFGFRAGLPTGFIPTAVVTGDFNGDGHMDAAVSNGGDNTIYVLLGNGDNTFQVPEILYTQGQAPVWIAAASLRNNGHLDLAVVDADSTSLEIFPGNGDGTFGQSVQYALPQIPTFILAGDFNKDGNPDLAVGFVVDAGTIEPQFEVFLGNGAGGFSGIVVPPPIQTSIYSGPTGWLAEGDINNDGYPDLLTTVTGGFAITYLNQAGTAFSQGPAFGPTQDPPLVVDLGDVDEDGCLDAVETDTYGYLIIARGTCDGNFTQGPFVAEVGDLDPAIKVVDVDGDGHLDVVGSAVFYGVASGGTGSEGGYLVSVLKGDGKGNFGPATTYRGGTGEFSLGVADFNGDNKPEIVTVDSLENEASLYINDGTGNFDGPRGEVIGYLQGVTNSPIPSSPLLSADLNGDGKPDLILAEFGMYATDPSQLTVMLNDGTGKFLPPLRTPITVGSFTPYPEFVVGPFRNPVTLDVVYGDQYLGNTLAFFPSKGDGTFAAPIVLGTPPISFKLATGDFNRDGKLDFVALGATSEGGLELDTYLGHGDGTFTGLAPQQFAAENLGSTQQLIALDLNHDGKLDLLIGNNDNGGWTTHDDLIEALGNGDGTFQQPTTLIAHFGAVAVADVNHDGYVDLIQARDPSVDITQSFLSPLGATVYLGLPDGSFAQQPSYDLPGFWAPTFEPVLAGDFNADGVPDFAVKYYAYPHSEPSLRILQGNGDGTFVVTNHTYQLQANSDPLAGMDFNGDGRTDLVELVGFTASFHTIPAAAAPSLDIALDSNPVAGNNGSASVTLDLPASGPEDVTLSANDPAIQLPPTIHFNTGQQIQHFAFTLGNGFNSGRAIALYAQLGGETATAYGSKPNPNTKIGVAPSLLINSVDTLNPNEEITITPGGSLPLILQLQSIAGYRGLYSSFQCRGLPTGASCTFANTSAEVPPGGIAQVMFQIVASSPSALGNYSVQVSATNGFFPVGTPMKLGIGEFTLSVNPAMLLAGPSGSVVPTVAPSATNGLRETITLACDGLPGGIVCAPPPISANFPHIMFPISYTGLVPRDYPFQIKGNIGGDYHEASAVLRVGDFNASLDRSSATVSPGESATFNVSLTSVNHYTNNIQVLCQLPDNRLSCTASPLKAVLTNGGTAMIQLTISATLSALARERSRVPSSLPARLAVVGLLPIALVELKRKRKGLACLVVGLVLSLLLSCGGGSSSGGNGGGGSQSNQISVPVIAQADAIQSDSNNQKMIGPIVITLQ
jgi:FG-GAP-like repeat